MVVNSMPYCYPVSPDRPGYLSQKSVSHLTGGLLQRKVLPDPIRFYIALFYSSWDTKLLGLIGDIVSISLRLNTPQLVIEVGYMQPCVQLLLKPNHNVKQANRIRPTRYCHHYLLLTWYQIVLLNEV